MVTITIDIPENVAEALRMKVAARGRSVEAWFRQRVEEEPRPRRRYTLEDLVSQCDPEAPLSREDREWLGSAEF